MMSQGLMPFRKPAGAAGEEVGTAGGTGVAVGITGCENNGAGDGAGAFDLGSGTPTAGAEAAGGACIMRV